MLWIVVGALIVVAYVVAAIWMGSLARATPERTFLVRRSRGGPRAEVTFGQWRRRYLPWGLAIGCALVVLGAVTRLR